MSQPNDHLLIDLTNAQQATALNSDSILHRMQLETFLDRVDAVVGRVDGLSSKLKQCGDGHARSVSYERYHDVITLHGKRGSGKTTFLLSALELLQGVGEKQREFRDNGRANLKNLCVLEVLDPTLFGLHEHLLLSLLAKIAVEVTNAVKKNGRNLDCGHSDVCELEKWRKSLSQFAKSLKHMGETRDDLDGDSPKETVPWDDAEFIFEQNMESARRSFSLEREFHKFLYDSLQLIGKKAFVLALDDIDTRPQIGWHVLEVLRRYFTSPQLVVVLSGDMELFKIIIEKQQLKIFDLNFASTSRVRKEFKSRVDGLTEQYLLKILRTPSRISLGSFQFALQQWRRSKPEAEQIIGKPDHNIQLELLLKRAFFPLLACSRRIEQRLFRQTLFGNPARTVTQVLAALWEISMKHSEYQVEEEKRSDESNEYLPPAVCESAVERMREVFQVSLQNMGFSRPFDLAEALQSAHGVNLLMPQLFAHGYVTTGLDLLPTRQNPDENNALLALNAEMALAMRTNPAVLLGYALKACFLREVLLRRGQEINVTLYEKYEQYLCLKTEEMLSVTAARISALHWGQPRAKGPIRTMGMVRLFGASITKNAPIAVKAMYGMEIAKLRAIGRVNIPVELQMFVSISSDYDDNKPLRRWVNTPETLRGAISSWQREFVGLGVVEIRDGDDSYRAFSVFPLLAALCDILENEDSMHSLVAQYGQIQSFHSFSSSIDALLHEDDLGEDEEVSETESVSVEIYNEKFINSLIAWVRQSKRDLVTIVSPTLLCSRIMQRFFRALSLIDNDMNNRSTYVGSYIHRCLIAFFNSVLVEEYLLKDNTENDTNVLLDSPTKSDDIFIRNMIYSNAIVKKYSSDKYVKEKDSVVIFLEDIKKGDSLTIAKEFPLFKSIFTCPIWELYLNQSDFYNKDEEGLTVFSLYMGAIGKPANTLEDSNEIAYGEGHVYGINLFALLNSLAIPKPEQGVVRNNAASNSARKIVKTETRTNVGKRYGLPLSPKSIKSKKLLEAPESFRLLDSMRLRPGGSDKSFAMQYENLVRTLYQDESVVSRLMDQKNLDAFWMYLRKNLKA